MADNKQIATEILPLVGGGDNVSVATNCMTRLRLTLKDKGQVDLEGLKKIKGVLGAQWAGEQLQVIIGQNVPKVLDEFVAMSGVTRGAAVDENLDAPAAKFEWTPGNVFNVVLDYVSGSMTQLLPAIMAGGLLRTIAVVLGPELFGLISAESPVYQFFYTTLYEAAFYFLPIYLGYACAKKLGASEILGGFTGALLIAPSIVAAATAGENISVYGISIAAANYSQTVLPIVLTIPVMAWIEKQIKKVMPDALSTVFTPFCTIVLTVPIALIVMGPIGNFIGNLIGNALFAVAGWGRLGVLIVMMFLGAFWQLFVVAGMHMPIIMLAIVQITQVGYDPYIFVSTNCAMFAVWGVALGAALRIKDPEEKGMAWGYVVSGMIGGVTEPALFGVLLRWRRTMLGMFVGGAAGALVSGLFGVTMYMAGGGNAIFVNFLNYVAGGRANLIGYFIGLAVSIVVAAIVTYLFGFSKEDLEEIGC